MDSYITELTAKDIEEGRGFPFEIEVPRKSGIEKGTALIKMDFSPNDQIFYFCIGDREKSENCPYSSLELVNNLLMEIATTLEKEARPYRQLPSNFSEIPFGVKAPPVIGESVILTTPNREPNSFVKIIRLANGWMIHGGGHNPVYLQTLHALLENAKSEKLLLSEE